MIKTLTNNTRVGFLKRVIEKQVEVEVETLLKEAQKKLEDSLPGIIANVVIEVEEHMEISRTGDSITFRIITIK